MFTFAQKEVNDFARDSQLSNESDVWECLTLWHESLYEYCTVTAEKASKQINEKISRNSPHSGMFTVSSSITINLK